MQKLICCKSLVSAWQGVGGKTNRMIMTLVLPANSTPTVNPLSLGSLGGRWGQLFTHHTFRVDGLKQPR